MSLKQGTITLKSMNLRKDVLHMTCLSDDTFFYRCFHYVPCNKNGWEACNNEILSKPWQHRTLHQDSSLKGHTHKTHDTWKWWGDNNKKLPTLFFQFGIRICNDFSWSSADIKYQVICINWQLTCRVFENSHSQNLNTEKRWTYIFILHDSLPMQCFVTEKQRHLMLMVLFSYFRQ